MDFEVENYRHAEDILRPRTAWAEIQEVIAGISMDDIRAEHDAVNVGRRTANQVETAGGQTAINKLFRDRFVELGWRKEPRLFPGKRGLRNWKMDFLKDRIGVEVSFNHAEATAWTFTRLNIAGEVDDVDPSSQIDVGVAIFACATLKAWARMDNSVITYQAAHSWLQFMKPVMPIPILIVGLEAAGWPTVGDFRGTARGTRTRQPDSSAESIP